MISLKRGDTFAQDVTLQDDAGEPIDLTGYTVASQVRDAGGALVGTLSVTVTDAAAGEYSLGASPLQTALWRAGRHRCDLRYESPGGIVQHTDSFEVVVVDSVTR